MATGLKIENVRKSFGSTEVLKEIDIEISSGQFLILVDPSGCGKSTLLNMIAGLETVTEGRIFIGDRDAKLRVDMRTEIKELHQRTGTTIVYVTHDQIEAMTMGDRIAIMHRGEIQQSGTPREIYDNPTNLFVAGFIGSPSMNFLPCTLVESDGCIGVELTSAAGRRFFDLPDGNGRLRARLDREVVLGIRPEQITHVVPGQAGNRGAHVMPCLVDITEPTGPDTLIITRINDRKVVCRAHPDEVAAHGEHMELMLDMSKAVLFDPTTDQRVD